MYTEALSWWSTPSNVIQTINENINHAVNVIENELEVNNNNNEDDEDEEENDDEYEDENEVIIYKKLLEDAQMQHVELSKQFRIAISEKNSEIEILKEKYQQLKGNNDNNNDNNNNNNNDNNNNSSNNENEKIITIKLTNEINALKETLNEMEEKMKSLLREKNEAIVKIQKYPELIHELNDLRSKLSLRNDNEAKKSEEIDNLVQEYSKLAADSEKQKSTDSLRIRELELENEVLTTRLQALEHSITELADRSAATQYPSSPSRDRSQSSLSSSTSSSSSSSFNQSTQLISENELKQLRTKVLNLEYDITEKDEKISNLEKDIKNLQDRVNNNTNNNTNNNANNSNSGNNNNIQITQDEFNRRIEEISNLKLDISRLQLEKQEAESTGKKFYDQLRTLQKEVELEKRKSQEESNKVGEQQEQQQQQQQHFEHLQTELLQSKNRISQLDQEKQQLVDQIEAKSVELNELTKQLENSKAENLKLQLQLSSTSSENTSVLQEIRNSHESEILKITSELKLKHSEEIRNLENQVNDLKSTASSSSSEKDNQIIELKSTLNSLEKEKLSLIQSHQLELDKLKLDLETSYLSNTDGQIKEIVEKLTKSHNEREQQMELAHESQVNELKNKISDFENQIQQLQIQHEANQLEITNTHQNSLNSLQQRIEEIKNQHSSDIEYLTKTHSEYLDKLRHELIEQGKEETKLAVDEALAEALINQEKLLLEQKNNIKQEHELEIKETIENQQLEKENALKEQAYQFEQIKEDALITLTMKLKSETEDQISNLNEQHSQQMKQLKIDCDEELKKSLEKLTNEHEDNLRCERLNHEREIERLKADHQDVVDELKNQITTIKDQLSQIESVHAEKLRKALDELTNSKDKEREIAVQNIRLEMQSLVDTAYAVRDEYLALYTKENKARKALHNKLMDIQGNIRVICRVRPILDVERRSGEGVDATEILSDEDIIIHRDQSTKNKFEFDRVLPPGTPQEAVFEAVQPLIISVLDGYNVCIFAYGQTGSGKTFTMEGYGSDIGVSPRAIDELFRIIDGSVEDWSYSVTFSSLEIYNESIRDLLDSSGARDKLDVRQTPEGNSVPGLTEIQVTQSSQVLELMRQSQTNRAVGAHDMNEHSSRSHSILTLTCRGRNLRDGSTTYGKLHLIDLAGSERVGKTDATGERLKEAQNINRSLSALGDVINSLGKKSTHIPYRNSKLTFLLQDSLGGNSKVLMFVNISPAVYNVGESICSLGFAQRCRSLELGQAKKQSDPSVKKATSSGNLLAAGSSSSSSSSSSDSGSVTPAKSSSSSSSSSTLRRTTTSTTSTRK